MTDDRIWITQWLCSSRHASFAVAWSPAETTVRGAEDLGISNEPCPRCGATAESIDLVFAGDRVSEVKFSHSRGSHEWQRPFADVAHDTREWTHAICWTCWRKREGARDPVCASAAEASPCCWCGLLTDHGIYVFADPGETSCKLKGRVHDRT